jgi:hypothetical protein
VPRQDWNLEATFNNAYNVTINGELIHYQRPLASGLASRWERILAFDWDAPNGLFITPVTCPYIGIVGCGFGWEIEYLLTQGWGTDPAIGPAVWGVDTSTYIQATKELVDPLDNQPFSAAPNLVAAEDILRVGERNRWVRDATDNNGFDLVVSADVVSTLDDAEADVLRGAMNSTLNTGQTNPINTLLHITTPLQPGNNDPSYNWKTLEEWHAFFNENDAVCPPSGKPIIKSGPIVIPPPPPD